MKKREEKKRSGLVGSAFALVGCYAVLCLFCFIMIVVNDPAGWTGYLLENYTDILTLAVCALLLSCIVYYYYYFEDRSFVAQARNILLIFSLMLVCLILDYVFGKLIGIYARPCALFALMCVFLFNRRQAILLNFIFSVFMFVIDTYTNNFSADGATTQVYYSLMLHFVCGTFAVFAAAGAKTRGGLLLTGCVISVPTVIIVTLLQVATISDELVPFFISLGCAVFGCVVSGILALAGLPVFEKLFNRLTVFRLRELTGTNAPLLVRLKQEAPGTFNHSLVVAQLAESCAVEELQGVLVGGVRLQDRIQDRLRQDVLLLGEAPVQRHRAEDEVREQRHGIRPVPREPGQVPDDTCGLPDEEVVVRIRIHLLEDPAEDIEIAHALGLQTWY